jgi:DNA repair protein RecO (recombination protein O)
MCIRDRENPPLFDLLLDALSQLGEPNSSETALRYFELHFLHHVGYRPQLRRCVNCDLPLKPVVNFFSPSKGGLLCPDCNSEENRCYEPIRAAWARPSLPLSIGALKVLRLWQSCDYATARRVRVKPELSQELEQVLCDYIRWILQRELKSLAWLKELRKEIVSL